jgi:hypothetical protein
VQVNAPQMSAKNQEVKRLPTRPFLRNVRSWRTRGRLRVWFHRKRSPLASGDGNVRHLVKCRTSLPHYQCNGFNTLRGPFSRLRGPGSGPKGSAIVQDPIWQWAIAKVFRPDHLVFQVHGSPYSCSGKSFRNISISVRSLLTTSCRSSTVGSSSWTRVGNSGVTRYVETPIGWLMFSRANSTIGPLRLSHNRTPMLGPSTGVRIVPFTAAR